MINFGTEIKKLLEKYKNLSSDKDYCKNEKWIANSLILPFFRDVLEWNTDNDFIPEYPEGGKRVDYLVFFEGISQFVVEAKSLTQEIRQNNEFYKKCIVYALYKEKRFAILTNFKYIIILDSYFETTPLKSEVSVVDIENLSDNDTAILQAFNKNSWKVQGESNPVLLKLKGKKRQKIDEQLLKDLIIWRDLIYSNLKKYPRLNKFDFDPDKDYIHAEIQRFIDRLLFICYCEDKPISEIVLRSIIQDKEKHWNNEGYIISRLKDVFINYWKNFDSDLFKNGWCDDFYLDDTTLIKILKDLRTPKDKLPYDFSVIEADILGKTYENFLGSIVTGQKRIKEKQSKNKRKSEGIYYTPTYIVQYIINNTVREYAKNKSYAEIKKIKILDPACGSASFLVKAYETLLEQIRKSKKELTYEEKEEILKNCIYGVDLDKKAVEIAKFNLSLKLAEKGKRLTELQNNIRNGNSLIDSEEYSNYPFKWEEQFKDIIRLNEKGELKEGYGFDIIIGNPPYLPIELFSEREKEYYFSRYNSPFRKFDTVILFIERAISLLKELGLISFIVPLTWQTGENYFKFREYIFSKCNINIVLNLPFNIFEDAYIDTGIFVFQKKRTKGNYFLAFSYDKSESISKIEGIKYQKIQQNIIDKEPKKRVFTSKFIYSLLNTINENTVKLGDVTDSCQGIVVSQFPISNKKINENYKKLLISADANRFLFEIRDIQYIDYHKVINLYKFYSQPRIFIRRIINRQNRLMAFYCEDSLITKKDYNPFILTNTSYNIKYLLGLINSKLFSYIYIYSSTLALKDDFRQTTLAEIRKLPIKITDEKNQLKLMNLVINIEKLNKNLYQLKNINSYEKIRVIEQKSKIDKEIDEFVYALYNLTEEEKKIIEDSFSQ